tara:strand:+ start:24696 stop:24935 length:240 start_codon:yes stop_codon:yes gene_type:complete
MEFRLNYLEIFLGAICGAILFLIYTTIVLWILGVFVDLAALELTKWHLMGGLFFHGLVFCAMILKILDWCSQFLIEYDE